MKNRNKAILVASLISAANLDYTTCSVPSNGATAGSTVTCTRFPTSEGFEYKCSKCN